MGRYKDKDGNILFHLQDTDTELETNGVAPFFFFSFFLLGAPFYRSVQVCLLPTAPVHVHIRDHSVDLDGYFFSCCR